MTIQTIRQKQIMFLLVVALLLVACNPSAGGETVVPATHTATAPATAEPTATATAEATTPVELTEVMLDNLAYQGIYTETVQLTNGKYEGEPFMEGNVLRPIVDRLPLTAFGDLNGDGANDAAVLLGEQSGGTGRFVYLAAVINQAGNPENVSTIFLGDRVSPQSLAITQGQIVMEIVTHADSDPLCCPSLIHRNVYALQGQLTLISESSSGLALPAMLVTTWYWLAYEDSAGQNNITVADPSQYSITFLATGRVDIQADCNVASAQATVEESSLAMTVGPMTAVECASGSLYDQFLAKLADVATFVFDEEGRLVLNLKMDAGKLIFDWEAPADS